jgi:hypothetical protein
MYSSFFDELRKLAFQKSEFSTPIEGPRRSRLASHLPPFTAPELLVKQAASMRDELMKLAFQTSQFSGPLSYGGFKQTSHLPPFSSPAPAMKAVRAEALRVNPASTAPVVKTAATIEQLRQGYRRLGITRVPKGIAEGTANIGGEFLGNVRGPSYMIPSRLVTAEMSQQAASLDRQLLKSNVPIDAANEFRAKFNTAAAPIMAEGDNVGGKIIMTPGGAVRSHAELGIPTPESAEGKMGVNVMAGMHEGFERASAARLPTSSGLHTPFMLRYGHADPNVLLHEQNALAGLTGPGADAVRDSGRAVRARSSEAYDYKDSVRQALGERGVAMYGQFGKTKLPKRVKKEVASAWRDTAALYHKAAAAGYGTMIPAVSSPARVLSMTRKVGQGKFGGGPGPSIGQISKPVNFGKGSPVGPTIAGATKSSQGI